MQTRALKRKQHSGEGSDAEVMTSSEDTEEEEEAAAAASRAAAAPLRRATEGNVISYAELVGDGDQHE
jgi:hypothetical protein